MRSPIERRAARTGLGALLLAAASATLAAARASTGGGVDLHAQVERHTNGPQDELQLVQAFVSLGTNAIPDLFALQVSASFEAFLPEELDPSTWVVAPDRLPAVALTALGKLPHKDVLAHVRRALAGSRDLDVVLAGVRVIGAARSAEGLPLALDVVRSLGTDINFPHARATVSSAFEAVLSDPRSSGVLSKRWKDLDPVQRGFVLDAALAQDSPAAAEFLATLVGSDPVFDLRVLPQLPAALERAPWHYETLDITGLLKALESSEPRVRALAANALGILEREDALGKLLAHASDSEDIVRHVVIKVLRAWSGNATAASPEAWADWEEAERRWEAEVLPGALEKIDPGTPPEDVMAAVDEIVKHPLHRRDAVRELARLLPRTSGDFAREICRTIQRVHGREAVPLLVEALETADDALHANLWQALRGLTGADLGPDPADWRDWLIP